jgi:hypothetical protein
MALHVAQRRTRRVPTRFPVRRHGNVTATSPEHPVLRSRSRAAWVRIFSALASTPRPSPVRAWTTQGQPSQADAFQRANQRQDARMLRRGRCVGERPVPAASRSPAADACCTWPPPPRTRPRLRPPGSGSAPPGRPDAAAVVHLHHRGPHPHRAGHGLRGLRRLESDNIWITRNDGTDWAPPSSAVPSAPVRAVAVHPRRFDHVYLGTEVGVFASEDGAATWLPRNEGPANCPASDRRFPAEPGGDGV